MDRRWHVEHANGREWTDGDLEQWAIDHRESKLVYCDMDGFMVDGYGNLAISDECGNIYYVSDTEDMVVVWDD